MTSTALRARKSTTLPASLLEEINGSDFRHVKSNSKQRPSRKQLRKQERIERKQRKAHNFVNAPSGKKRPSDEKLAEEPQKKKIRLDETSASTYSKAQKSKTLKSTNAEASPNRNSQNVPSRHTVPPRTERELQEDEYISLLETKLGYGKGKERQMDDVDGLDDLLDFTSTLESSQFVKVKSSLPNRYSSIESNDETRTDEEWAGISVTPQTVERVKSPDIPALAPEPGTRYVPPHLRKLENGISKLSRQLKGLLNRMSERNLSSIIDGVEEAYRNVTSTLTGLIIDSIGSQSLLLDSHVALHASFVSCMHKLFGVEFAAYFVQTAVEKYESAYELAVAPGDHNAALQKEDNGKECSNMVLLLSELYNFQVISCTLLYDIIRSLLDKMSELNVELLLKILRSCGQPLRQDDPSALKDIIQIIQEKTEGQASSLSSRARFIVETLANLNNKKTKKVNSGAQNQGGMAVERLKKFIAGVSKHKHVLAHEPLRVSLEDLHSAETKGKWWLVGASWAGDPLVDRQQEQIATGQRSSERPSENALLKLAKKQGMNTDIRRSIFVVLMSSDDYVEACDRLSQLSLSEFQQREIIRVVLHCCGNERTYNPYYSLVVHHLCQLSHSYRVTLQFCLWDFMREMGENTVGGAQVIKDQKDADFGLKSISNARLRNVAKSYAWWIAKESLTLVVLKPVDFTVLKTQAKTFLRQLLQFVCFYAFSASPTLHEDIDKIERKKRVIENVFVKAVKVNVLAKGLVYFINEMSGQRDEELSEKENEFLRWAFGVGKDILQDGV